MEYEGGLAQFYLEHGPILVGRKERGSENYVLCSFGSYRKVENDQGPEKKKEKNGKFKDAAPLHNLNFFLIKPLHNLNLKPSGRSIQ